MPKGRIVVFEGIDGAGTETQSKHLLQHLKAADIPAERLYYPNYDNPIGRLIHEYLHGKYELTPEMQLLLYGSDMVMDRDKVNAWLAEGKIVIMDRYFTSALAYQTLAGLPLKSCLEFARMFHIPEADYVIYLKLDPVVSMKRKEMEKGAYVDKNERDVALQKRVSLQYHKLIEGNIFGKWYVLDGEKPIEEVFKGVRKILKV